MPQNATTRRTLSLLSLAGVCVFGGNGCKARELGGQFSGKQAPVVDNTWLIAANSCWPELSHAGYTLYDVQRYLADPKHFRATFGTYASLDDKTILQIVGQPVQDAPAPDTSMLDHSPQPVLSRADAVQRKNLGGTEVSDTNGIAPADSLCAIQPGTPVGFR